VPFALLATSASVLIQRRVASGRATEAFSMLNAGLLGGNAVGSALVSATIGPAGARLTLLMAGGGPLVAGVVLLATIRSRQRRAVTWPGRPARVGG